MLIGVNFEILRESIFLQEGESNRLRSKENPEINQMLVRADGTHTSVVHDVRRPCQVSTKIN
jgi:hypothetical protein